MFYYYKHLNNIKNNCIKYNFDTSWGQGSLFLHLSSSELIVSLYIKNQRCILLFSSIYLSLLLIPSLPPYTKMNQSPKSLDFHGCDRTVSISDIFVSFVFFDCSDLPLTQANLSATQKQMFFKLCKCIIVLTGKLFYLLPFFDKFA